MTFSEMVNANALAFNNQKTLKMVERTEGETPYFVQIAVNNLENCRKAVELLDRTEWVDGIDINFGCPVKKAIRSGFGGVLLKPENHPFFREIIRCVVSTTSKPVSIKMRLGFEVGEFVADKLAQIAEEEGVQFITLHGRYVKQMYRGKADHKLIGEVVKKVSIPVVANGDIVDRDSLNRALKESGAAGASIGRGAIGKPWIFWELKEGRSLDWEEKREVVLAHFRAMVEFYGDYGVVLFRKHLHQYSKGMRGASRFRELVNRIENPAKMEQLILEEFGR
jgi:tRNA-dihydrouridine synthase B